MTKFIYTTQRQLRKAFWDQFEGERPRKLSNGDYPTDIRVYWCDFIDALARDSLISAALCDRATLE